MAGESLPHTAVCHHHERRGIRPSGRTTHEPNTLLQDYLISCGDNNIDNKSPELSLHCLLGMHRMHVISARIAFPQQPRPVSSRNVRVRSARCINYDALMLCVFRACPQFETRLRSRRPLKQWVSAQKTSMQCNGGPTGTAAGEETHALPRQLRGAELSPRASHTITKHTKGCCLRWPLGCCCWAPQGGLHRRAEAYTQETSLISRPA